MAVTKEQIQRVQRTPSIINTGEKELYVGFHFQITSKIKNSERSWGQGGDTLSIEKQR